MFVFPDLYHPKPLDQLKNVTLRTCHKLSMDKKGQKNWPKSAKIRFPGSGAPACWPERPAPEAPRLPAEVRQASIH